MGMLQPATDNSEWKAKEEATWDADRAEMNRFLTNQGGLAHFGFTEIKAVFILLVACAQGHWRRCVSSCGRGNSNFSYAFLMIISTISMSLSGARNGNMVKWWAGHEAGKWHARESGKAEGRLCYLKYTVKNFKCLLKTVALYIHYISVLKIRIRKLILEFS